jgi:hypothetical protein
MIHMLIKILTINQNIIKVDNYKLTNESTQNMWYGSALWYNPLDSDFGVKSATVQVYSNNYNSQSNRWIGLKFYMDSADMFSYYGLIFQVNRTLERHRNTGQ